MPEIDRTNEQQRCRKFYENSGFVRRIVDLYAEGVSWKGCKVITPAEPDKIPVQYSHIIDVDAIKNGVRDMLVDGTGKFNLKVLDSVHVLSIPMPGESPTEEPGRSLLWPVESNAQAFQLGASPTALKATKAIIEDVCRFLGVPLQLLSQNTVTADPTAVMEGLRLFKHRVDELRTHIAFHTTKAVKPLISKAESYDGRIEVVWNEDWYQSGIIYNYGPVYQVFKAQGIELKTLREQSLNGAKSLLDNSLISKQTYEESVKWFLES
jgi:hypothetical protein